MRFLLPAFVCAALSCGPAWATGGLSCRIADKALSLEIGSAISHGLGDGLLDIAGTATVRDPFAPQRLRKFKLDAGNLPHHWVYGNEIKLRIYAETADSGPFASVDIALETTGSGDEEAPYAGTYRLVLYRAEPPKGSGENRIERTGKASCSLS